MNKMWRLGAVSAEISGRKMCVCGVFFAVNTKTRGRIQPSPLNKNQPKITLATSPGQGKGLQTSFSERVFFGSHCLPWRLAADKS